jgi:molybdenum cofactor cytidylyltransferase
LLSKIVAVVLAAGTSTRLGTNKLCMKLNGEAVVRRSVRLFIDAGIEKVVVVTGFESERVEQALSGLPLTLVRNRFYQEGMSSSVKAALPLVGACQALFIHLGDKPFVKADTVQSMYQRYTGRTGSIIVPVHKETRGHPVLVDTKYLGDMGRLEGDQGLRQMIGTYEKGVSFVESGAEILMDIDTEEDVDKLMRLGYTVEKD